MLPAFGWSGELRTSATPHYGFARYRVTIALEDGVDRDALIAQLAATYRARIETFAEEGFAGFVATMTDTSARMLSNDPHVRMVEEFPNGSTASPNNAATKGAAPKDVASTPRPSHPTRMQANNGTEQWSTGTYHYDGAGNIRSIVAPAYTETYTYDSFGRVTSGTAGAGRSQAYTYDRYGNILTITTDGDTAHKQILGVDGQTNRISNAAQPNTVFGVYDLGGNMTSFLGNVLTFTYDASGMITTSASGTKQYVYTPEDERIASITVANNSSTWDWTLRDTNDKVLRQLSSTGTTFQWVEDDIYRGDTLLAAEFPTRRLHFHPDHLGTPRLITDGNGTKVSLHTYYPFGLEATSPLQDTERMKFTGHERDADNLDYMHARSYLPTAGRFLSVDPELQTAGAAKSPQLWNRYSYAVSNPMSIGDPDGRCPVAVLLSGGGLLTCWGYDILNLATGRRLPDDDQPPRGWEQVHARHEFESGQERGLEEDFGTEMMLVAPLIGVMSRAGASGATALRAGGAEAAEAEAGPSSTYVDTTNAGSRVANRATSVTQEEAAANLRANGFAERAGNNGATVFEKDGLRYTLKASSKSGPPTAYVVKGGQQILKIRLAPPVVVKPPVHLALQGDSLTANILNVSEARDEFDRLFRLIDRTASLPDNVFYGERRPVGAIEFDTIFSRSFARDIQRVLKATDESELVIAMLCPDPDIHFRQFGVHPMFRFAADDSIERFIDAINCEPNGSVGDAIIHGADVLVLYPRSLDWLIYGHRDFEIALVADVAGGGLRRFMATYPEEQIFSLTRAFELSYDGVLTPDVRARLLESYLPAATDGQR
jgi:RHS repeat-associated protein